MGRETSAAVAVASVLRSHRTVGMLVGRNLCRSCSWTSWSQWEGANTRSGLWCLFLAKSWKTVQRDWAHLFSAHLQAAYLSHTNLISKWKCCGKQCQKNQSKCNSLVQTLDYLISVRTRFILTSIPKCSFSFLLFKSLVLSADNVCITSSMQLFHTEDNFRLLPTQPVLQAVIQIWSLRLWTLLTLHLKGKGSV